MTGDNSANVCPNCGGVDFSPMRQGNVFCKKCGSRVEKPAVDWDAPDPEMGGFRAGRPAPIPSRFSDDEFYRGRGKREARQEPQQEPAPQPKANEAIRRSKLDGGTAAVQQEKYRRAMLERRYEECSEIARELTFVAATEGERAEATYALALAFELGGRRNLAATNYGEVLRLDANHEKAKRRLENLKA